MTLTLETALSLISPFHEFLNVSIWTLIIWTWCWHSPKKWPIPTIAQECRFWQGWIWWFAHPEKLLEFWSKALELGGPSLWIYLKVIYYLSSTLVPKGLNIPIDSFLLSLFQWICPQLVLESEILSKIQCDVLTLAPIISILDLQLHITQCLRVLGSLLFWSCLLWNFPEASVYSGLDLFTTNNSFRMNDYWLLTFAKVPLHCYYSSSNLISQVTNTFIPKVRLVHILRCKRMWFSSFAFLPSERVLAILYCLRKYSS